MLRFVTPAAFAGSLTLLALLAPPARADEKGEALLREVTGATKKVKSLSADLKIAYRFGKNNSKMTGALAVQRPNLARIDVSGQPVEQMVVSNGKTLYLVMKGQKQYMKQPADPNGANIQGASLIASLFFTPQLETILAGLAGTTTVSPTLKGTLQREGVRYQRLEVTGNAGKNRLTLYISPKKLVQGILFEQKNGDESMQMEEFLSNLKVGTKLPARLFAYTPPVGFKVYEQPDFNAKLLAVGAEAPPFELSRPDDKSKFSLAKMLEGRKAVIVNFWFYG